MGWMRPDNSPWLDLGGWASRMTEVSRLLVARGSQYYRVSGFRIHSHHKGCAT